MSLSIQVHCRHLSDNLIPGIMKRMNELDMIVEAHPDFTFNEAKDYSGFLPFKFRFKSSPWDLLSNKELRSGFELYIDDFDLVKEKRAIQPKPGFLAKLTRKKIDEVAFASPEIESRLANCSKVVSFVWHPQGDDFEYRFAALTSAILSELTNGVRYDSQEDMWYDNTNLVTNTLQEVLEYEANLNPEELIFHEFESW